MSAGGVGRGPFKVLLLRSMDANKGNEPWVTHVPGKVPDRLLLCRNRLVRLGNAGAVPQLTGRVPLSHA